jgi:type II secretory pathway pseudopilin PulG
MKKPFISRLTSQAGLSLVEATIILMVLATLTGVIAPSAADYIEESRNTKAKEDVEAIGIGIARLLRDTGLPCVSLSGASATCNKADKVEVLVSGPDETLNLPTSDLAAFSTSANFASAASLNWAGATTSPVAAGSRDIMDPYLVSNTIQTNGLTAPYTAAGYTGGGGPRAGLGWRGAYLNGPIDVDPWGYAYEANTVFAGVATNATAGTGEGALSGGWGSDMLVISAGSNGNIQTAFGTAAAAGAVATGDDVVYVIQGTTR